MQARGRGSPFIPALTVPQTGRLGISVVLGAAEWSHAHERRDRVGTCMSTARQECESSMASRGSASCASRARSATLLPLVLDREEAAVRGIGRSGGRRQRKRTRGREKWGDWAGAAHGRAERGCVGHTRSPRTAVRLVAGKVEADGSSGVEGTWRG
jgi:hypothetical protein